MHKLANLFFRHADLRKIKRLLINIKGCGNRRLDAVDLGFGFASAQCIDHPFGGDNALGKGGLGHVVGEQLIKPVAQAVGVRIVGRVVERNLLWIKSLQHL